MAKKSTQSFEEQVARLEGIISILDNGDAPMDEMLILYEEAMALTKSCREYLDKAEQRVTMLSGGE
ncbi:MAG: exodeoxyribonuclease VII small subunit [Bacteroidetes bacterium]|nr:exodeoxyribonuclease VII small subunit [Bacteroidota bacterium]